MMLGPRLQLKQSQQLVMTPQLQQAIKLLQMSNLDVSAFVAEEAERNPLLSLDDGVSSDDGVRGRDGEGGEAVDRRVAAGDPAGAEDGFDTGAENLSAAADRLGPAGEPASAWSGSA
ncbi:MAG: RNA polymerase sigma-54 factor, partial [Pseudomonadota bacterium]